MDIFTYRPANCVPSSLLLVFHGLHRNAQGYRDDAVELANRLCAIEVAPLFDEARFPTWRYQKGGIVHHSQLQDSKTWTGEIVLRLIAWLRGREANPILPYFMIGHSAGAQFLARFSAFTPNEAQRIVIANPSTYVLPDLAVGAPFGLQGVPGAGDELLRRQLAQPLTLLLGQEDLGDKDRDDSEEARRQGATRYERGLNTFRAAQAVASARGWPFNWRLLEVPGTGHNARAMFTSAQALDAFRPSPSTP
jgi:hypothetical protein